MDRPYRGLLVLVTVAVLVALVASLGPTLIANAAGYRRDPSAFTAYVNKYVGGWWSSTDPQGHIRDSRWARSHPRAVLAEGDKACAWLSGRPWAPRVDPTGKSIGSVMALRYLRQTSGSHPAALSSEGMFWVVSGAWGYLCRGDRAARTAPKSLDDD